MRWLLLAVALAAGPALAQIKVDNAWARATAPGSKIASGYMTVHNGSAGADRLLGVASPAAQRVEMHITIRDADVARMRQVQAYEVPARGRYELKPGGAHLMFIDIKAPFKEGQRIPAVLRFEKAGEVKVEFHVGRIGAASPGHPRH